MSAMRSGLVAVAVLAGCYQPKAPPGAACATNGDCPSPYMCMAGLCGSAIDAAGGSGDGSGSDDAPPDTPGMMIASNGVDPTFPTGGNDITISGIATFDTDTGAISGALNRPAVTGISNGIGFESTTSGGAPLGVFAFHKLTVTSTGKVHFTGAAAAVFAVNAIANIDGEIDGSGGCYGFSRRCAGPGGGAGTTLSTVAGGCGPGGPGAHDATMNQDSGGGGGGGGGAGAAGGTSGAATGGAGGIACIASDLQPLVGGSGGRGGGPGDGAGTTGGGGGGAFQLTVFGQLSIGGKLGFGGAGGEAGSLGAGDASAGGGGGAGGGILIEADMLTISTTAILAANGGGGGGGGALAGNGQPGVTGGEDATPPAGGLNGNGTPSGGAGGANTTPPVAGAATFNAGGGGGGLGLIYIRTSNGTFNGTASPPAGVGPVLTR